MDSASRCWTDLQKLHSQHSVRQSPTQQGSIATAVIQPGSHALSPT